MKIYRTDKSYFLDNSTKIKTNDLIFIDDYCFFKTNKKLSTPNNLIYDFKSKVLSIAYLKIGFILGFFLFISLFFINLYRVTDIKFNGNYLINSDIKKYINNKTKKVFNERFIKVDYKDLSKELRANYISYEWIEVKKIGTVIHVNINSIENKVIDKSELQLGSLFAKKEGIIYYYEIYSGKPVIEKNDYVEEGSLLVSSNLGYGQENSQFVSTESRGLVLAITYEDLTINIKKKEKEFAYTGNVMVYKQAYLFNKKLFGHSKKFKSYDEDIYKKSYLKFLNINYIVRKEKNDIIKIYDKNEALEKAKSIIYHNFKQKKVSDLEKIEEIFNIEITENKEDFTIKMTIKAIENIAIFKKE